MSFPTAAQLAQLTTEINTDPKALGYAPLKISGSDGSIAAILNATYGGVGTVFRTDVQTAEIEACLVQSELSTLTTNNWLQLGAILSVGFVDASVQRIRNQFVGLFPVGTFPLTNALLVALAQKASPTRAEELFGYGTVVQAIDVAHALGRG